MKTQCDIVRDLMPLCIDGAASAESTKYVEEHIAECEECKAYYEKMKAVIPKQEGTEEGQEQAEFNEAAELMKLKHRRRVRRNVLIGILIGVLSVTGIYIGWKGLVDNDNGEIPTDQYSVSLAQLKDGRVIGSVDYQNSKRKIGGIFTEGGIRTRDKSPDSAENPYLIRLWMTTPIIPQYTERENRNGPVFSLANIDEIDLIVVGKSNDQIIWKRGEKIPQASQAMENYYQAEYELLRYECESELKRHLNFSDYDIEEEMRITNAMGDKLEQLRQQVPEWQ